MAVDQFWLRTAAVTIDQVNDKFLLYQNASSSIKPISRNVALGITGAPVGTTDAQTLSSKVLTSPTINGATLSGTLSGTYTIGGTPTFPSSVVTLTGTQTLTNKSLTAPAITGGTISNASINVDSISGFSTSTIVTVGGVQMNNGTISTSGAVTSTSMGVGAVQPQALASGTGTGWAWQAYTPTLTNITIGTGGAAVNSSRYIQTGKTVNYRGVVGLGSAGASVTGTLVVSLPITASTAASQTTGVAPIGYATLIENAVNQWIALVYMATSTTMVFQPIASAGAYGIVTQTANATTPFTWAGNDSLIFSVTYEAA